MIDDIAAFLTRWLPSYVQEMRALPERVAIGCTGPGPPSARNVSVPSSWARAISEARARALESPTAAFWDR